LNIYGSDSLTGGAGANLLIGGEGNDTLNQIAVADDFDSVVDNDRVIGGNAPQARPAPVRPAAITPTVIAAPAVASSASPLSDNEASSDDNGTVNPAALDEVFGDALIVDLFEI
jgi:hypothetical protein